MPSRPFCEFMLAILLLGISSAQAQVYYSTLNIQWNGQLDSSDDVLVTNQIDGIVTCLYAIAANGVTGENCDAAIFAYQYTGPGNPDGDWDEIFNEEVIEDNPGQESSASGVGSFGVVSNQVYQLEADVQNSGNAAASFFIPTSVLGALPAPWQQSDVGAVAVPGSAGCDTNNNFTIQASGSGITNQADAFHYVYQTLTGDGQIIACVTGVENTSAFAEAGVMVRETLAANSSYAFMAITPSSLAAFGWWDSTGQASGQTSPIALPIGNCWVKLVRAGNVLTGYYSTNGVTWFESSSLPIAMQTPVLVGLASTANNKILHGL